MSQKRNVSINVPKVNITEIVNIALKKLVKNLGFAIEVLPLIYLEKSMMVGLNVPSRAASVIMEFVSPIQMVVPAVSIAVKHSVDPMNSGTHVHLHVVT